MAVRSISGKKIQIVSDPEGFRIPDVFSDEELYICGDLIDSTIKGKKNDFLKLKSHNLYNIQKCVKANNIFLAFGNRDLNKLKCRYLCELKIINEDAIELITKFNTGNIELTYTNYQNIKDAKPEWVENHKNWYPYWNTSNPIFKKDNLNYEFFKTYWIGTTDEQKKNMFKHRYDTIFGVDPTVGTMSADNVIDAISEEINLDLTGVPEDEKEDFKAFVTLAIFKSMCMNNFQKYNQEIKDLKTIKNSNQVRGWLCEMYRKQQSCYMLLDESTNVYLLSHGGISSTLIKDPEILSRMRDDLVKNPLRDIISDSDKFYQNLKGGFYDKFTNTAIENVNLTKRINRINQIIKESINSFITSGTKKDVKFLLTIATGFNCNNFKSLLNPLQPEIDCTNLPTPLDIGPIMPGIESLRKSMFIMENRTIYQIIGHKPIGINTIVDLYETGNDKSVLINLDISNTFMSMDLNKLDTVENKNLSFNKLIIEKQNIDLISNIYLNINELNLIKIDDSTDLFKALKKEDKDTIFYSSDYLIPQDETRELIINGDNNMDQAFFENIKLLKNNNLSYNCKIDDKFHVVTYMNKEWKKGIYIVNDKDFKRLNNTSQLGGYKQKYLKYKSKYLNLKNQL
jgi:hypothetical protein